MIESESDGGTEAAAGWADPEPPARWLRRIVAVFVVVAIGSVVALAVLAWTASDVTVDELGTGDGRLGGAQTTAAVVWAAQVIVMAALLVVFIVWTRRLATNHVALARPGTRFGTPVWAVFAWLLWFLLPFFVVRELWKGSDPGVPEGSPAWRGVPTSPVVAAWFVPLVLGVFATNLTNDALSRVTRSRPDHLAALAAWRGAATAVLVVSALVLWRLAVDLTERQAAAVRAA